MDQLIIILVAIIFLILIIVGICVTIHILGKNKINNMYLDVENVLKSSIKENEEYSLKRFDTAPYDYEFIKNNTCYYIKIVPNFSNEEICVNNSVKWQLSRSFKDTTMRFVPNIEGLMRFDVKNTSTMKYKKLYIIYPNARGLLKYVNECEMVFIRPDTNVYGTNIIPFVKIKEDPKVIELNDEKLTNLKFNSIEV